MEGSGNMGREGDFIESREKQIENPVKKLMQDYAFIKKTEPELSSLAEEEGRGHVYDKRSVKNESQLCNWKKSFQEKLLLMEKMEEMINQLKSIKGKFCNDFAVALQKEMKVKLAPSKYKEMTRLTEDEETKKMVPAHFLKAREIFDDMEKGMLREITAIRALNEISDLGIEAKLANSELDINNKIDIIACSTGNDSLDNIVYAIQVKGNHNSANNEAVEEVTDNTEDSKKKEFYKGSERFEKKLNRVNSDVKVIKIWLNISDQDIKIEGAGVDNNLKVSIEYGLREILKKYRT